MPMIDVVADASVVLKWFHDEGEEEVGESRALVDHHRRRTIKVSVIDLTAYEIGNALLRGKPRLSADRVSEVLRALEEICRRWSTTAAELADAANLAEQHGLTMYDAAYAAAARSRGGRLATLDRDLLRVGLGQRPSQILSELTLANTEKAAMTYGDEDLSRELARYEQTCIDAGMRSKAVHSYWDQAQRFLNWRIGKYQPRRSSSSGRPVPSAAATTTQLRNQAGEYMAVVEKAGLEPVTVDTYYRYAMFFVRWLDGDFEPGGTL
jgi:predicted nucleic acid-binding protein